MGWRVSKLLFKVKNWHFYMYEHNPNLSDQIIFE